MMHILHFSDLHLAGVGDREGQFSSMKRALAEEAARGGELLLMITGDLFTTSKLDPKAAITAFQRWHAWVKESLGRTSVHTVIVPGNHDVRGQGVFGPSSARLLAELRDATVAQREIYIHFTDERHPAQTVLLRRGEYGLPADTLFVDSTYLAQGYLSAGGVIRPGDLLKAIAALLPQEPPSSGARAEGSVVMEQPSPLFVVLHHHLIPNQVTDESLVTMPDSRPKTRFWRWVLRNLVANADHEEMTMTVTGAGTVLSMLHALHRPILVLHGHKHYPVSRLLRGVHEGDGDILLASAGSAGVAEPWRMSKIPGDDPWDPIWPSFNVVDIEGANLIIRTIAYDYRSERGSEKVERQLVHATLEPGKCTWEIQPVADEALMGPDTFKLESNRAVYELQNAKRDDGLWTATLERTFHAPHPFDGPYLEVIDVAAKAVVEQSGHHELPIRVALEPDVPNRFNLVNAFCGTHGAAQKAYKDKRTAPFDWVDLFNRFGCEKAELVLRGYPGGTDKLFGSVVDLTTGVERPARLTHVNGEYRLSRTNCPPRTLLKIWWPLVSSKEGESP